MYQPAEKRFIMVNYFTIIMIFVVILAGGIVRSTGSGMGCPDWPKCFNRFIPPTDVSQLPEGYEQHYIEGRQKKNIRFAKLIRSLGFNELAGKIENDKTILKHEEFNAAKTWTEYINRLSGATLGVFLLATFVLSISYLRSKPRIVVLSLFNLLFVFFQAWMGSIVVSTNLTPWVITVHMLLALVILAVSIYTYYYAKKQVTSEGYTGTKKVWYFGILLIVLTLVQVVIGTDVREDIDMIAIQQGEAARSNWVDFLGASLIWHREIALATVLLNLWLFFMVRSRFMRNSTQQKIMNSILVLIFIQVISGLVLAYLGMPAYMQTVHLVISTLIFGAQYYFILLVGKPHLA